MTPPSITDNLWKPWKQEELSTPEVERVQHRLEQILEVFQTTPEDQRELEEALVGEDWKWLQHIVFNLDTKTDGYYFMAKRLLR